THFDGRTDIVERAVEHLDGVLLGTLFDHGECAVNDPLCGRLLAVLHQGIHELGYDEITELGIGMDVTLFCTMPTGHDSGSPYFGRFAPYLDRRCLRSLTDWVSSTPRSTW